MKFIAAIAAFAAAVGTVYATPQSKPQRKRSIENKYITNVDEHKSSPLAVDPYMGLSNRKLEGHTGHSMSMHDMTGTSYCTWSPDKTCYATGWPACCEDEDTCPEERPPCDVEYDKCADYDTLSAAEEACRVTHECGELEDVNFGPDCAGNKEEHCTEIKACSECEEEIRAMFNCEHGEKCGEGLGTCEDDHDGDDHGDEDDHKDDEHTSEDGGHEGHDHGEDGETDHSDDMDKDAAASTDSGAATLTAGAALLGGVALMMA